jgi:hypothetical protein
MARGPTDAAGAPAPPLDTFTSSPASSPASTPASTPAPDEGPTGTGRAADEMPPADAGPPGRAWRDRLTSPAAALGLLLVPFAVGIVVLLAVVGGDYHPVHDLAQIELRVRDVGHHEVLLGPYSREGWYHPGPAMFFLLALPYRLTGGASVGMDVGALLINGAAVAGMVLVARRRGGTPLFLITLVACGLLVRSLGPDFLRDPWNPSLPVLSFGLVLFLSWAMTCGEAWALPLGAAVASFVVQTHIGYLALALPLVAWGAAWLVALAVRRPDEVPRWRLARAGLVTLGVLAVLWAPAVIQQVTAEPGNLGEAFEYFRLTDEPGHDAADAWRVVAAEFTTGPEWIAGNRTLTISGEPTALYGAAPIPVLLVVLIAAAVVLWRKGTSDARRLLLTLALALGLGALAVVNTRGLAFMYRLRWVEVLGMTAGVVVLWAAWLVIAERAPSAATPRRLGGAAVALVLVLATAATVGAARAGTPQAHDSAAVAALVPEVVAALPEGDEPVLIRPTSFGSMLFVPALLLGLEREGVAARIDPITAAVGEHRLHHQGDPLRAQLVIFVDEDIPARFDDPALELVAQWGDPPTPVPGDPVDAYEAAFPTGDTARLEDLARSTLDQAGELRAPFTLDAVAVFTVRPGHRLGPPPDLSSGTAETAGATS